MIAAMSDDGLWLKTGSSEEKTKEIGLSSLQNRAKKKEVGIERHVVSTICGSNVRSFVRVQIMPIVWKRREKLRKRIKFWESRKVKNAVDKVADEEELSTQTVVKLIGMKIVPIDVLANLVTGSLYDPVTGQCLSGKPKITEWHVEI